MWTGIIALVCLVIRRFKSLGHSVKESSTSAITGMAPAPSTANAVAM